MLTTLTPSAFMQGETVSVLLKAVYELGASSIGRLAIFGDLWLANVLFAMTVAVSLLSLIKMAPKN